MLSGGELNERSVACLSSLVLHIHGPGLHIGDTYPTLYYYIRMLGQQKQAFELIHELAYGILATTWA
jgi:hypothetical protein